MAPSFLSCCSICINTDDNVEYAIVPGEVTPAPDDVMPAPILLGAQGLNGMKPALQEKADSAAPTSATTFKSHSIPEAAGEEPAKSKVADCRVETETAGKMIAEPSSKAAEAVVVTPDRSIPPEQTQVTAAADAASQEKHPLSAAAESGRYAAARRELLQLQKSGSDPREFIDDAAIQRIQRIGDKFDQAMKLFELKPEDLKVSEQNQKLGLRWGMKLDGNILQLVSITDYDADFVKMVCLDLEADLEDKISNDTIRQELLSRPHAHEASWRKRLTKAGVGSKSEDIMMISSVDALDEPVKSIVTLKYNLDVSATADPFGTQIPNVDPGYLRTPYLMTATAFTPLAKGGDKMRGVRKFEIISAELPSTIAKILGMMPSFMLKKLCRGDVENKAKAEADLVKNFAELDRRLQAPPRSHFLEQVRSHLTAYPGPA